MLNANLFPYLLGLAAFLFSVGAMGVLIRRNPIVVFMCIELMLNAGNLALVAYGRFLNSEEGQIFAFMVIVVAAVVGVLGRNDLLEDPSTLPLSTPVLPRALRLHGDRRCRC